MRSQDVKNFKLPDSPGVYLFKKGKEVLYVGRATSLKDRVKSYFANDLIKTRGPLLVDMVTKANDLEFEKTDSVLEAIILEANLIKKIQPIYNTKEKDNKSFFYVVITKEDWPRVLTLRERDLEKKGIKVKKKFGPYTSGESIKEGLRIIRKIFPFADKDSGKKWQKEFYKQLNLAPEKDSTRLSDYLENIKNIETFLSGKKKDLLSRLEKKMGDYAKKQEFERANEVKKQIFALNHIKDVSLIKKDNIQREQIGFRIESYDISHTMGSNMVGVMTVVEDGLPNPAEYRQFKIKNYKSSNDTGALKEVLQRRLAHPEWPMPNLIVVDGGVAQKRAIEEVLREVKLKIPVASVVKNEKHKPKGILGQTKLVNIHKNAIIISNQEAHRFAISFQRKLQRKNLII